MTNDDLPSCGFCVKSTNIGFGGRRCKRPVVLVPVDIVVLRTSLPDELLVLETALVETALEILSERPGEVPLVVAKVLLRRDDGG